jgi:hypothetical protein
VPADDWPRFPGAIFKSTLHRRPHQGDSSRLDLGESILVNRWIRDFRGERQVFIRSDDGQRSHQ